MRKKTRAAEHFEEVLPVYDYLDSPGNRNQKEMDFIRRVVAAAYNDYAEKNDLGQYAEPEDVFIQCFRAGQYNWHALAVVNVPLSSYFEVRYIDSGGTATITPYLPASSRTVKVEF